MVEPQRVARLPKDARSIPAAVVGEDALTRDAPGAIPGDGALEKGAAAQAPLIRQDLHVGQARVIVDGDVHVLPATRLRFRRRSNKPPAPRTPALTNFVRSDIYESAE